VKSDHQIKENQQQEEQIKKLQELSQSQVADIEEVE